MSPISREEFEAGKRLLPDALQRLLRSALPADPTADPDSRTDPVDVNPSDLRILLRFVMQLKHHTPADACVICRHKDREHRADLCESMDYINIAPCRCPGFVPVESLPFGLEATT